MSVTPVSDCVWAVGAELGEGPIWREEERAVYFVDIKGRKVHSLFVESGKKNSWAMPDQPGFIAPLKDGNLICGLPGGLYRLDTRSGEVAKKVEVEGSIEGNRLNDGHVDSRGRLWFGSMHDGESERSGSLYRLCDDRGLTVQDDGYVITNGPAISPDGHTLYHADTLKRIVYAFDLNDAGVLSRKRPFVQIEGTGFPDGMAVDADGFVWVAMYGGWRIDRYSPDSELIDTVRLPCANVTKLAFGGNDLRDVYVTTAWKGLTSVERSGQPLAGALFSFRSQKPGMPQNLCTVECLL
ncbi:MAG: SMP-30/gluconolactonase/LRE family protein [Methylocella sp.]